MANNLTTDQHLQALASAAQQYNANTQSDTLNLIIEALRLAGGVSKATPVLAINEWSKNNSTYSASLSYSGDGVLSTNIGSISGTTLTISDDDGIFSGVLSATAGTSFAATSLNFFYFTAEG